MKPSPGHFYAVGVGPGAPDLLTLRAINLIKDCDAIIAPRSNTSKSSLALAIIKQYLHNQEILEVAYPMVRDQTHTQTTWDRVSDWVMARASIGKSIVQITLGDPLIYSTSNYLIAALKTRLESKYIHVVPGISAAQAMAAICNEMLASQEDRITILSANDIEAVSKALDNSEVVAIYKVTNNIDKLINLLEQKNLLEHAKLGFAIEQESQKLITDLHLAREAKPGYMSVILVRTGHRNWLS